MCLLWLVVYCMELQLATTANKSGVMKNNTLAINFMNRGYLVDGKMWRKCKVDANQIQHLDVGIQ